MSNSKESDKAWGRLLPEGFVPRDSQVIVCRGKQRKEHEGNVRFRVLVESKLKEYVESSRGDKTFIIMGVVYQIRRNNEDKVGFVRRDIKTGRWMELTMEASRFNVAQAFRNSSIDCNYKSSQANKRRKCKVKSLEVQKRRKMAMEMECKMLSQKRCKMVMEMECKNLMEAMTSPTVVASSQEPRNWQPQAMRVPQGMPREQSALPLQEVPEIMPAFAPQGPMMLRQQQQRQINMMMTPPPPPQCPILIPVPVPVMMHGILNESRQSSCSLSGGPGMMITEEAGVGHHQDHHHFHQQRGGRETVDNTSEAPWPAVPRNCSVIRPDPPTAFETSGDVSVVRDLANHQQRPDPPSASGVHF